MGCPAVSKSLLIWFECSSPDQKHIMYMCVCITIDPNLRAGQCHLMAFARLETGLGWLSQPCQCDLSLKRPPPQQSPLLPRAPCRWRWHCSPHLVSSFAELLNETPDESVLTNLTWVYGCHLPGEAVSVLRMPWTKERRFALSCSFFLHIILEFGTCRDSKLEVKLAQAEGNVCVSCSLRQHFYIRGTL